MMIELPILKEDGVSFDAKMSLSEDVFGCAFNEALVHQVLLSYQANGYQRTKGQKNRAKVNASGAKPWRQKGTGRARAGTRKSPIWRGGGRTFAANPDQPKRLQKINKKMYRSAMRSIVSEMIRQKRFFIVESLEMGSGKTSEAYNKFKIFGGKKIHLVVTDLQENLYFGIRNLHHISVSSVLGMNPLDLIRVEKLLTTQKEIKQIEEWLKS